MKVRTVQPGTPSSVIPAKAGIHAAYPNTNAARRPTARESDAPAELERQRQRCLPGAIIADPLLPANKKINVIYILTNGARQG